MNSQATTHGAFGLMVLGLVATLVLFLGFAVTGMNLLDDAGSKARLERIAATRAEEQRLHELQAQLAQLRDAQHSAQDLHLSSERDVERLRAQVAAETERMAQLRHDLADIQRIPIGSIYGAAHREKSVQYVECVDGAAVMQPQGKRFAPSDADGLAKAVPAGNVALLVRPGGFKTFQAVWSVLVRRPGLQLGYLPVEREWQLDYSGSGGASSSSSSGNGR